MMEIEPELDSIEVFDSEIRRLERERLRNMHLAAMRSGTFSGYVIPQTHMPWVENIGEKQRLWFLGNALWSNVQLNALCAKMKAFTAIFESNASEALLLLSLAHPAFNKSEHCNIVLMIYDLASMSSYPDTGPDPTVREIFLEDDIQVYQELVLRHYKEVAPKVAF